jgi:hypothetical protein
MPRILRTALHARKDAPVVRETTVERDDRSSVGSMFASLIRPGAKNFEDAVLSFAATIYLLVARLGQTGEPHTLKFKHAQVRGRAA